MKTKRLQKLADHLDTVIQETFNMTFYCVDATGSQLKPRKFECGTVCCALGHAATLWPKIAKKYDFWEDFCIEVFGLSFSENAWHWLFDSIWCCVDNTPTGAANRIRWLIENGLPENWYAQMLGKAPLCYQEEEL